MRLLVIVLTLMLFPLLASAKPQVNEAVQVRVGNQAKAAKSKLNIRFAELLDDSRCPKGTACVWSGEAKIRVQVGKPGGREQTFELSTLSAKDTVEFAGYKLRLVSVTPQPAMNVRIDRTKYTATIDVTKSGK